MEKAKLHSSIVNLAFSMKAERFAKGDNGRLEEGEFRKGVSVQDRWKRLS